MHRYRHFDEEFDSNNTNRSAILPELEVDEPFPFEINPQLHTYPTNYNKFKICFFRRTYLERFLSFIVILLLIVLFIIIIYSLYYYKKNSIHSLCLTPVCIELSHTLSSAINESVDPCEDFHEFSCGRWTQANIIPKGYSQWSPLSELTKKNLIILKHILEQKSISSLSSVKQDIFKYYQSCINETEIERLNIQPLENYFQNNLNFTLQKWINIDKTQTYQQLFISLSKIFSMKSKTSFILPIEIGPDEKNSTWNNIYIDQPVLGLESRDYYINSTDIQSNTKNQLIRDTYSQVGAEILQLLGFEKNDSIQRMNDIIQFETELAIVSLPKEILQKRAETYYLMTLKQLQELYKTIGFDIVSFFNDVLNINTSNSIKLNENDQIIVSRYDFMLNVSNILTNYLLTPNKGHIVIDHMLFLVAYSLSSYLPSIFGKTLLPLDKIYQGTDALPERWELCVTKTDKAFGYGLGALYIDVAFGENDRLKVKELTKNIREIFGENLNKLQWIDAQSKIEARKKLEKINEKIGYPDFIKNETALNEIYSGYPMIENEFFNNQIKIITRNRRQALAFYRQKVDLTYWDMTPRTVNAYYSMTSNEITFPAGILQPPFFHKDLPLSISYGGIGSIIGHEITHGFDSQGREFDSDGNIRLWWTKYSLENFQEKTKCFLKQYSNFSIVGENENGERTLSENIADNGGVKLSYSAYQKNQKLNIGNNLRLPGLNYNSDQLFFISFAHIWCNIQTLNSVHYNIVNDVHSPGRFRVIGVVQNSDAFSKAFSCKSKTKMNPSDKCQLW